MNFTKEWEYQTQRILKGRYDGCIFKVPLFISSGEEPDLSACTDKEISEYHEIEDFYIDFLSFIARDYKDQIKELGVKELEDVNVKEDIRLPSWFYEYRKMVDETGKLPLFNYEQANEFAIIYGLDENKQDLTPEGNPEIFKKGV